MYAQILAAIVFIPLGLSTLMRGSDGLNAGRYGTGEAAALALAGAVMILSGLALLLGIAAAGAVAVGAMAVAAFVTLRRQTRVAGPPTGRQLAGRFGWMAALAAVVVLGWR
jgi:hypothetical protein